MPTWAGTGDGLFAMLLEEGAIDAVHMVATDSDSVRRSIRKIPLAASGATVDTAFQTLNASVVIAGLGSPQDQLSFYHPSRYASAIWRPPAVPVLLDRDSFAAVPDSANPDYVLEVTSENLVRRRITDRMDRIDLIAGTHIPRPTGSSERPYILLQPTDDVIGVTIMRMLPADQGIFQ